MENSVHTTINEEKDQGKGVLKRHLKDAHHWLKAEVKLNFDVACSQIPLESKVSTFFAYYTIKCLSSFKMMDSSVL